MTKFNVKIDESFYKNRMGSEIFRSVIEGEPFDNIGSVENAPVLNAISAIYVDMDFVNYDFLPKIDQIDVSKIYVALYTLLFKNNESGNVFSYHQSEIGSYINTQDLIKKISDIVYQMDYESLPLFKDKKNVLELVALYLDKLSFKKPGSKEVMDFKILSNDVDSSIPLKEPVLARIIRKGNYISHFDYFGNYELAYDREANLKMKTVFEMVHQSK